MISWKLDYETNASGRAILDGSAVLREFNDLPFCLRRWIRSPRSDVTYAMVECKHPECQEELDYIV